MTSRKDRLKKLVKVQEQLKALHETRHAGFVSAAAAAESEARELIEHFDTGSSLGGLFPELYHRRIANALGREKQNLESAQQEAARVRLLERQLQALVSSETVLLPFLETAVVNWQSPAQVRAL